MISLIDGRANRVPKIFHALLDASISESGSEKIRLAPYHLEMLVKRLVLDNTSDSAMKDAVTNLCSQVLESKTSSSDEREALFVLILPARCCLTAGSWLPSIFSEFDFRGSEIPAVVFSHALDNSAKYWEDCKTSWNDLEERFAPQAT
jgi:hypothetical protein